MRRPIRILELRSVRGTGGGPEKTILLGAARSDPTRYSITVCYIRDSRDHVFRIGTNAEALPIEYVELWERNSFDLRIWKPLRKLVRERRIDIVHAHDYKTDLLAFLLSRVEPIAPLATAHGWTGHSLKELKLYYPLDRHLLARYPRTIAVSSEIKRALIAAGAKPDTVTVVLNGIDHEMFRRVPARQPAARAHFGFGPGDVVIGTVGRLEPQKNFRLLLESFEQIASVFPRAHLVIAGEGSQRGELEGLIALMKFGDRCHLLGQVSDVSLLHHALDVFVQSSDYEGTPNVVLEAMAFETPLVATDVGGTSELVRDGREGLIVPPREQAALVSAIRRALTEPTERRDRAHAARRRVEGDLSFASRMRKVEVVYDELSARLPKANSADRRVTPGNV